MAPARSVHLIATLGAAVFVCAAAAVAEVLPISSFSADGKNSQFSGPPETRFGQWRPLAICIVPSFQRLIPRPRGAHVVQDPDFAFVPTGRRVHLPLGIREAGSAFYLA